MVFKYFLSNTNNFMHNNMVFKKLFFIYNNKSHLFFTQIYSNQVFLSNRK